jgi:hypothetical protein
VSQPGLPSVSRFEYNLLRILRFLLGHMPAEQAMNLVYAKAMAPPCLSPACLRIAEDTIAKAVVQFLVKSGGWRKERFLRGEGVAEGRVWERVPMAERGFRFSGAVVSFLVWLTAEKPTETREPWDASAVAGEPGDQFFFALALDALRAEPSIGELLAEKKAFRSNPLCWLMNASVFANRDEPNPPDFSAWMTGERAAILECLQPLLANRWIRTERAKGQLADWRIMRRVGAAESAVLAGFLEACEKSRRRDLARFLLRVNGTILAPENLTVGFWTAGLQGQGPPRLAERLEIQRLALGVTRQMETLERWTRQAQGVGYMDEEYAASQWWKSEWEARRGESLAAKARTLWEQLQPLRTG